jgi:hypothetical protein
MNAGSARLSCGTIWRHSLLEPLNISAFLEALPAFLPPDQASQQRLPDLLETLGAITTLTEP